MAKSMDEYINELHQKGQGQANQLYTQRTESDQQLIDQVNAAIDRATQAATKPYQTQMEQLPDTYRKIYDTNAVQELVGRRQLQETMANMGLTDSGLNRTQQTALSLQRGNADADARLEQQKKTQELQDRIAQLLESGAAQKQQQEATVRNNTSNWYNALQTDMYNNAVEQETNLYNQALAREEQARQLELERQNALAVAQEEAKKAQAEAAAQAKQQAFDNQLSVISAMEKAGASSDSIMAYMQSIGLLPKGTSSTNNTGSGVSAGKTYQYAPKPRGNYLANEIDFGRMNQWEAVNDIIANFSHDEEAMKIAAKAAGVYDLLMSRYKEGE